MWVIVVKYYCLVFCLRDAGQLCFIAFLRFGGESMSLLQSIILGVLQGVTEFLPVSSSGHLAIVQHLFNINTETNVLFNTLVHLGTLVAVCIVYWENFSKLVAAAVQMIIDIFMNLRILITNRGKTRKEPYLPLIDTAYKKLVVLIIITSIPTAIIGLVIESFIGNAMSSLFVPGVCLVITAIILLISDGAAPGKKKVKRAGYGDAAIVGVAQGISVLPGISRSGATITTCMLLGFERSFAVKYSFLASIPAILGANLLELRHLDTSLVTGTFIGYSVVGMIVAGVVGYFCLRLLITLVRTRRFNYFAYYCAAVGILCILIYFIRG